MNSDDVFIKWVITGDGLSDTMTNDNLNFASDILLNQHYIKGTIRTYGTNPLGGGSKVGVAFSENQCLDSTLKQLNDAGIEYGEFIRVFILYDRVRITDTPKMLADAFICAINNDLNLMPDYMSIWTTNQKQGYFHMIGKPEGEGYKWLTDEEIKNMKPFQKLPGYAGNLAAYYGKVPVNYRFHCNNTDKYSEDLAFFRDNPDIIPSFWDCNISHYKGGWLRAIRHDNGDINE